MALTKDRRQLQSSTTNTAGSTTTATAVGVTDCYSATAILKITNGGTGPTVACSGYIETADSGGSDWFRIWGFTGPLSNSASMTVAFELPPGTNDVRSVFTGNTGQSVTVEATLDIVTAL